MAFIYPFHAPSLPTKWDDPVWVHEICPSTEHALLATLEQKRTNQVKGISREFLGETRELRIINFLRRS
ncbi:hypothetical protein Q1695_014056 [Nippostrongylus brasiliensis]|nr:hypothetical protein Q1695_014056 [Nippostrongylus brasiliensis]